MASSNPFTSVRVFYFALPAIVRANALSPFAPHAAAALTWRARCGTGTAHA